MTTDAEIVREILGGNDKPYEELIRRYYGRVLAMCRAYVADMEDCHDLAQEVFTRCYLNLDTLKHAERFGAFAAAAARNAAINWMRKQQSERSAQTRMAQEPDLMDPQQGDAAAAMARDELHHAVRTLVHRLPAKSREVVLLYYFERLSTRDIAEFLQVKHDAVRKRLEYARNTLRSLIEREMEPALDRGDDRAARITAAVAAIPYGQASWFQHAAGSVQVEVAGRGAARWNWIRRVAIAAGVACVAGTAFKVFHVNSATSNRAAPSGQPARVVPESRVPGQLPTGTLVRTGAATATPSAVPAGGAAYKDGATAVIPGATLVLTVGPPPTQYPDGVRDALISLITRYNEGREGVTVQLGTAAPGAAVDRLTRSQLGDIMIVPTARIGETAPLATYAEQGFAAPIDRFLDGPMGLDRSDFISNTWQLARYQGQTWGIPFLVQGWGVAVDAALLDHSYFVSEAQRWSAWPGMLRDMGYLADERGNPLLYRPSLPALLLWESAFLYFGGQPDDENSFNPASQPWHQATFLLHRMFEPGTAMPAGEHRGLPLGSGPRTDPRIAIRIVTDGLSGNDAYYRLATGTNHLALAPMPLPQAPGAASVLVIKRSTPEREAAAWEFAAWLAGPDTARRLYDEFRVTPIRSSVLRELDDPAVQYFAERIRNTVFPAPRLFRSPYRDALLQSFESVRQIDSAPVLE